MSLKEDLFNRGSAMVALMCDMNDFEKPRITAWEAKAWHFPHTCAYYRKDSGINICLAKCAGIGTAGRQWSYPGYTVDRTPYGVLAHELGHAFDLDEGDRKGPYFSNYSIGVRLRAKEEPLTGYCPNDAEWFAEMFRLFVTNPNLLKAVRPKTHKVMVDDGFVPCIAQPWQHVLSSAPERTFQQALKKVGGGKTKPAEQTIEEAYFNATPKDQLRR